MSKNNEVFVTNLTSANEFFNSVRMVESRKYSNNTLNSTCPVCGSTKNRRPRPTLYTFYTSDDHECEKCSFVWSDRDESIVSFEDFVYIARKVREDESYLRFFQITFYVNDISNDVKIFLEYSNPSRMILSDDGEGLLISFDGVSLYQILNLTEKRSDEIENFIFSLKRRLAREQLFFGGVFGDGEGLLHG